MRMKPLGRCSSIFFILDNVAYVAHVYADSLVLVLQKERVVVGRGTLFGSLVQEGVLPFHAFGSCIQFCLSEGFQQVVYRFHFIAFHGIVAIRSSKHHQGFHFQRAHEVEPAHIGHIYVDENGIDGLFLHFFFRLDGILTFAYKLQEGVLLYVGRQLLECQRLVVDSQGSYSVFHILVLL